GVPGLYAAGEVAGGMHGSNRLGGNLRAPLGERKTSGDAPPPPAQALDDGPADLPHSDDADALH
ncbi:FAD-binding protein, partial [Streptomyces eurythermus]